MSANDLNAREPSDEKYDWKRTGKPERPWLLPYHQTLVMKMFLGEKNERGEVGKIYLTFAQALEVMRKLDNLTCGIPKVIYLVGWQFCGHDSKYPALSGVNESLKRPQDKSALESLHWLMREGLKYHARVSLHINMLDAYEDSPLWDSYVRNNIIYKDKNGEVFWGSSWGGQRSAPVSYHQEWKLGFARQRIDGLLAMLPELREAATIHIDAFHTFDPNSGQTSPWLGHGPEKEAEAQRRIYRYFRNNGIDVTSEFVNAYRTEDFAGLQPMAWHFEGDYPPELYCGTPMHAEPEIMKDPENLSGLREQFCLNVVPWYYSNNTSAVKGNQQMRDGNDLCMPALWKKEKTLIAYSRDGYAAKQWELPPDWKDVGTVAMHRITLEGLRDAGTAVVTNSRLTLRLDPDEALLLVPAPV